MMDDVKGHHSWVSEVKIARDNNINNLEMSNLEVSTKLENNYWIDLLDHIESCKEGKRLRTYASFKHVIEFELYLNSIKNYNCRRMLRKI